MTTFRLLGIQVGLVAPLVAGERQVMSGIHERPVTGPVAVGPLAPKKMVQTGYCGFYFPVDRPGLIEAGQAFELVAGPRRTPLMALFPKADRR